MTVTDSSGMGSQPECPSLHAHYPQVHEAVLLVRTEGGLRRESSKRVQCGEPFPSAWPTNTRLIRFQLLWARTDCAAWKDAVLLNLAESEARIMLTLDKDFWQIAVQRRVPLEQSGVVLFRVHPRLPGISNRS